MWPTPQTAPISAAWLIFRYRETMVVTAITWSGSVACRIPKKKPSATMESRLIIFVQCGCPALSGQPLIRCHESFCTLRGGNDASGAAARSQEIEKLFHASAGLCRYVEDPHPRPHRSVEDVGRGGGDRTHDLRLKRPLLYH